MSTPESLIQEAVDPLVTGHQAQRPVPTGWAPPDALIEDTPNRRVVTTTLDANTE